MSSTIKLHFTFLYVKKQITRASCNTFPTVQLHVESIGLINLVSNDFLFYFSFQVPKPAYAGEGLWGLAHQAPSK